MMFCRLSGYSQMVRVSEELHQVVESDGMERFYFQREVCQSSLDGHNGSNACTVIAVNVYMSILDGSLPLPQWDDFHHRP